MLTTVEDDASDSSLFAKLVDHRSRLVEGLRREVDGRRNGTSIPVRSAHVNEKKLSRVMFASLL